MKNSLLLSVGLAASLALTLSGPASAQDAAQQPPAQAEQKAASKPSHKVWTDDDMSALRSPADVYTDNKDAQQASPAATATSAQKQPASAKPDKRLAPPALSNPKTVADADAMIAWEKRDIGAQTEYLEMLKKQIDEAAPEDKERLQKLLQDRTQLLAKTRAETEALEKQKTELQTKAAAPSTSAAAQQPPSQ